MHWECLATQWRKLEDNLAALCDWLSQNNVAKGLLGLSTSPAASRGGSHAAETRAWEPALLHNCDLLSLILDEEKENGACAAGTRPSHNLAFLAMARAGIKGLLHALQDGDRSGIHGSAALLAGLGPGLTPAGDDYLVGLMAGLRVWPGPLENGGLSPPEVCRIIFEAAEGRTTLLSRAFLRSAKEGLFGENWHELLAALVRGDAIGIQRAARRVLSSGATSGADALAGFLSPYLYT